MPSAGALWKAHLGMQLLPSLVWGSGERRKYRAGGYTHTSKDWPLCPSFFHLESLTMCLFCVQWKTHFTEEGFHTVHLRPEVPVVRYNKEFKKKEREADGRHMLTKVRALSIFKESIVKDLYSGNYITRDSMTKEIFL